MSRAQLAELRRALQCVQAGLDATDLLWVVLSSLIVARTSVANVRTWSTRVTTTGRGGTEC
jgi:hypothetical protein